MKELLEVYWSYQCFGTESPLIDYCDVQEPTEMCVKIAELGAKLSCADALVVKLFSDVPGSQDLIISKLLEIENTRILDILKAYKSARHDRPSFHDRLKLVHDLTYIDMYRTYVYMASLLVPLLVVLASQSLAYRRDWKIVVPVIQTLINISIPGPLGSRVWSSIAGGQFQEALIIFLETPVMLRMGSIAALFGMAVSYFSHHLDDIYLMSSS